MGMLQIVSASFRCRQSNLHHAVDLISVPEVYVAEFSAAFDSTAFSAAFGSNVFLDRM
jgi:hypothetical protein